jgi:large subunit ribosomal protein L6
MSRIGKKLIPVPAGVDVKIEGGAVRVKGPKGILVTPLPAGITVEKKDGHLVALRESDAQAALHGLVRSLVANAVHGVSQGFQKELDIIGLGYRAENKGKFVVLTLGYSHPIEFPIPEGITVSIDKQTHLVISGADKQKVGQVAANIRALRTPDPYKQKGVRYTGERLKKKVGKAGAAAGGGGAK